MNDIEKPEEFDLFDDLVNSFDLDKALALKFFLVFSWFEHILKELGFYKNRGYIDIDWMRFGNELDNDFKPERTPELKKAVEYLVSEAPRNQRIDQGKIEWKEIKPKGQVTRLEEILFWVTTVRNNFFHGGKIPKFRVRDAKLLRCCLIVLDECVHLQGDFQHVYQEQIRGGGWSE